MELWSDITIQQALYWLGYLKNYSRYGIDGDLGEKGSMALSREDIKDFQQDNDLDPDGIVGEATQIKMKEQLRLVEASAHFNMYEFMCEVNVDGTPHDDWCMGFPEVMNITFVEMLERFRQSIGSPLIITSGIRCQTFNDSLSGSAKDSYHRLGRAVDCYSNDYSPSEIAELAEDFGFKVLRYDTFTHLQYNGENY